MDIDWLVVGALAIGMAALAAEVIRCRLLRAFGPTATIIGAWLGVIYKVAVLLGVGLLVTDLARYVERNSTFPVFVLFGALWLVLALAIGLIVDHRSGARPGRGRGPTPPARVRD